MASPVKTSADSRWSIHTAASFLAGNAGRLNAYEPEIISNAHYAIEFHDGNSYGIFPIGTSLLSVPLVFVAEVLKPGLNDYLTRHIPAALEGLIASFYGAVAGTIFFWIVFLKFRSVQVAGATNVIFCFGTSIWSVATRALWQHGPLILMLTIAIFILCHLRRNASLIRYLGIPLAAAFMIRPTAAIPIGILSVYILTFHRSSFIWYLAGAMITAAPWLLYNYHVFHHILPAYYLPQRLEGSTTVLAAMLGNLVSPARGLIIFSPVLLAAVPGFFLSLGERDSRALSAAFASIITLHWLFVSRFPQWWGGYCFGPRLMSDILPFLLYFVSFAVQYVLTMKPGHRRKAAIAMLTTLTAISITIHAQGALSWAPYVWLVQPSSIDVHPERLWDWSDMQFTRGFFKHAVMPDFGPLLPGS